MNTLVNVCPFFSNETIVAVADIKESMHKPTEASLVVLF